MLLFSYTISAKVSDLLSDNFVPILYQQKINYQVIRHQLTYFYFQFGLFCVLNYMIKKIKNLMKF
jgi:hypothetical protein